MVAKYTDEERRPRTKLAAKLKQKRDQIKKAAKRQLVQASKVVRPTVQAHPSGQKITPFKLGGKKPTLGSAAPTVGGKTEGVANSIAAHIGGMKIRKKKDPYQASNK